MKKITFYLLSMLTVVSLSLAACNGGEETNNDQITDSAQVDQTTPDNTPVDMDLSAGQKVYVDFCMVCHQESGEGVEGTFPPLANSDYMLGDKMRAVKQAIYGSKDPMRVYVIEDPGHIIQLPELLTDEQVCDVVN